MTKKKRSRSQILQIISQYGIHIWAILIIANAAMVYAYNFSTHASTKLNSTLHTLDTTNGTPAPSGTQPTSDQTQPQAPQGPSINLAFSVPGIGSGGATLTPIHLKRNVIVFLYAPDVNSLNSTVKPLYTIKGIASYDTNPASPTYTSFVNPVFDLGSAVKDGNYQITFRTDQSLRTLIKQNPDDIGGEVIGLNKSADTIQIPHQTVLMGDTIPDEGDNSIDISDYNAFINCYGARNTSNFCKGKNYGDFDDNGVIDGVDYNILLRSFTSLLKQGQSIPKVAITQSVPKRVSKLSNLTTPTVTQAKQTPKLIASPSASPTETKSGGSSIIGGIFFFFFLILLGGGFFLYKKNLKIRERIQALIHLSPTGTPATQPSTDTTTELTDTAAEAETPSVEPAPTREVTPPPTPEATQTPPVATTTTEPSIPVPTPPPTDGTVEKECYVKTKGPDEAGTGMWLLLTDDNGPVEGHYAKNDAKDGFAKVKGVMKTENGKTFLEVSELTMED